MALKFNIFILASLLGPRMSTNFLKKGMTAFRTFPPYNKLRRTTGPWYEPVI